MYLSQWHLEGSRCLFPEDIWSTSDDSLPQIVSTPGLYLQMTSGVVHMYHFWWHIEYSRCISLDSILSTSDVSLIPNLSAPYVIFCRHLEYSVCLSSEDNWITPDVSLLSKSGVLQMSLSLKFLVLHLTISFWYLQYSRCIIPEEIQKIDHNFLDIWSANSNHEP